MPDPKEPERYELDDMMERLTSRSGDTIESGELVTRADGSQAVRVRKRKRRTEQPHKNRQRRLRMWQLSAALLALVLLVAGVGFATIYANSSLFRKEVVKKIEWSTGAKTELTQFRMNPVGAHANRLQLEWPLGNPLESATLGLLSAEISPVSFFGRRLHGGDMSIRSGKVVLRMPEPGMPTRLTPVPEGEPPVNFGQYAIKDFEAVIMGRRQAVLRLSDSEATLALARQASEHQLRLARGNIWIEEWPDLRLDRAHLEFPGERVEVVSLRLLDRVDARGVMVLTGTLRPFEPESPSVLKFTADGMVTSAVLGEDFGALIDGRIDTAPDLGVSELRVGFGPQSGVVFEAAFRGSLGQPMLMQKFPFLFGLAQTVGDEWFSQPIFEDVMSGRMRRETGCIALEQLEFSSKGRMSVRGSIEADAKGRLSGQLEVGVAHAMISTSGNQVLDHMFSPVREGYRWISLDISGTSRVPTDSFSRLYEASLEALKNAPEQRELSDFESLTQPR